MQSRRTFIKTSAGIVALGPAAAAALARQLAIGRAADGAIPQYLEGAPIDAFANFGETVLIDGVPFWNAFKGDRFLNTNHPPFLGEWIGYGNSPPPPTESSDIVIIGGGLGGLCTGYLLRDYNPLLLDHNSHYGGNAQAESWDGLAYSIGGAYCITPDKGGDLDLLYTDLGVDKIRRDGNGTPGEDPVAFQGRVVPGFWHGYAALSRTQRDEFQRYFDLCVYMSKFKYPDIPLPKQGFEWILELDRKTFKQDVIDRMGGPVSPLLEAAIQLYFYSSYCAGWEEISAAAGWNFVAAEPYGVWVFPAGMASMSNIMYERLHAKNGPDRLRTKSAVLDVRPFEDDLQVTVGHEDHSIHVIRAQRVVMACPKFVVKHLLESTIDQHPERLNAINLMDYRSYVVINVLLNVGQDADYFDLYLMEDGSLAPPGGIQDWHRPVDAVNGTFSVHGNESRWVLTFYWPIPYSPSRAFVGLDGAVERIGSRFLPHMDQALAAVGLSRKNIVQVRMARWGHPLPISSPNIIAEGRAQLMRSPIDDRIFFVHSDNWALPAVENTLLDAIEFAPQVVQGL